MPNPYIIQGIGQGLEKASQTLLNVSLKKKQLEQKKKDDDIDYKIKNFQLQKLEREMDPTVYEMGLEELKNERKYKNALRDLNYTILKKAESGVKNQIQGIDNYAKGMADTYVSQDQGMSFPGYEIDLSKVGSGKMPLSKHKEKEPTWKQQSTVDAVKSDILRRKGVTYSLMGEPQAFEMENEEDVLDYISQRGFSPELFEEELKKYRQDVSDKTQGIIIVEDKEGNQFELPKEQLNIAIEQGYKEVK